MKLMRSKICDIKKWWVFNEVPVWTSSPDEGKGKIIIPQELKSYSVWPRRGSKSYESNSL